MQLAAYLDRIGIVGPVRPNLTNLKALHRKHLLEIPYENLDVQHRRPVDLDPERIFDKIVRRQRGGWCYEMNGLFGWALGEVGFDVTRMVGGVGRIEGGDAMLGNHLVLTVELDGPWLVDVGLGNGLIEPIPLREGRFEQGDRRFRLESLGGDVWRFHNTEGVHPPNFDFVFATADEELLGRSCGSLQSDPESLFRQNLICQRLRPEGVEMLLGCVLLQPGPNGPVKTLLETEAAFIGVLERRFGLRDPENAALWPQVRARHEAVFGAASAAAGAG